MAEIKSIDIGNSDIDIHLSISHEEYQMLRQETKNILLLPARSLNKILTTGKLGNSNRIMVPKKILKPLKIDGLDKKIPAAIFNIEGKIFLLARITDTGKGIPHFR